MTFYFCFLLSAFFFCAVLFHWCWCCCFYLIVCVRASLCWRLCLVAISSSPTPLFDYIKPSGEPIVPRGPQLSALSLRPSSCFSPAFPRCRPNPLAANRKPKRHGHLSKRQLCRRRRGSWLRQPVPHSAVLPIHRVALQQVGPCPPPWGCPRPVSISGQHPEGPKVRKNIYLESALACWWSPLFRSLSTFTELTEGQIHQVKHNYARKCKSH